MTDRITPIELKYEPGIGQKIRIATGSVPVSFLNRAGQPTVYFIGPSGPEFDEGCAITLVAGANATPANSKFIGTAEFRGGQAVLHAFFSKRSK